MTDDVDRICDKVVDSLDGEDLYTSLKALTILFSYSLGKLIQSERDLDTFLETMMPAIREDAVLSMKDGQGDNIH